VGDGGLRGDLEQRARAAGVEADFLSVVPHGQLPRHFQSADCFVLPSLSEGNPKALIEAMACGLPCAASARGGIPSMLEDGVTGLLFDPERVEDIAGAIGRLLADRPLADGLGERARAQALALFDAHVLLKAEVAFVQSMSGAGSLTDLFEDYARDVRMDKRLSNSWPPGFAGSLSTAPALCWIWARATAAISISSRPCWERARASWHARSACYAPDGSAPRASPWWSRSRKLCRSGRAPSTS
jgi:hypothetical protein